MVSCGHANCSACPYGPNQQWSIRYTVSTCWRSKITCPFTFISPLAGGDQMRLCRSPQIQIGMCQRSLPHSRCDTVLQADQAVEVGDQQLCLPQVSAHTYWHLPSHTRPSCMSAIPSIHGSAMQAAAHNREPVALPSPLAAVPPPSAFGRRATPAAKARCSSLSPHETPSPASPYPPNLTRSEAVLANGTIPGFSPPTPPLDFVEPRGLMQPDDSSEASQSPRLAVEEATAAADARPAERAASAWHPPAADMPPAAHAAPPEQQQQQQQQFRAGQQEHGQAAEPWTPVRQPEHAWPSRAARQRQGQFASPVERGHNPLLPASVPEAAATPARQLEDIQALARELQQLRSRPRHALVSHGRLCLRIPQSMPCSACMM